jgi:hypothetical protein
MQSNPITFLNSHHTKYLAQDQKPQAALNKSSAHPEASNLDIFFKDETDKITGVQIQQMVLVLTQDPNANVHTRLGLHPNPVTEYSS